MLSAAVSDEELSEWEREADNGVRRRDRPHGSPERLLALVRASRAREAALRQQLEDARSDGYDSGYDAGYSAGYEDGADND